MRKLDENNNLQEMRIAGGYRSARAFAEVCGLNPNTYMNYEQGTVPIPLARAAKFAELLNCSIEEIAGIKVTCIIDDDSEELLLHNFRKLTPREKASLLIITQSMITAGGGAVTSQTIIVDQALPTNLSLESEKDWDTLWALYEDNNSGFLGNKYPIWLEPLTQTTPSVKTGTCSIPYRITFVAKPDARYQTITPEMLKETNLSVSNTKDFEALIESVEKGLYSDKLLFLRPPTTPEDNETAGYRLYFI